MTETSFAENHVLVTGGCGYIGARLVEELVRHGNRVRVLSNVQPSRDIPADIIVGDCRSLDTVSRACEGIDTIFHLAGKAHDPTEPQFNHEQYDISVGSAMSLALSKCGAGIRRLVFLSSLAVYGPLPEYEIDETYPCAPDTAYGGGKLLAEKLLLLWGSQANAHVTCLRPALVYGPGAKGNLDRLLRLSQKSYAPRLPQVPLGRVMVHVNDLVSACIFVATNPACNGQCYNVTDGNHYKASDIVDSCREYLQLKSQPFRVSMFGMQMAAIAGDYASRITSKRAAFDSRSLDKLLGPAMVSNRRLRELGWAPQADLWSSMPEMLHVISEQR